MIFFYRRINSLIVLNLHFTLEITDLTNNKGFCTAKSTALFQYEVVINISNFEIIHHIRHNELWQLVLLMGLSRKALRFVGYFPTTIEWSVQQKNKSQFTSWLLIITMFYNNLIKAFWRLVVQFQNDVRMTAIAEASQRIYIHRYIHSLKFNQLTSFLHSIRH